MTRLDLPNGMWLDVKEDVKAKDKRDSFEYSGLKVGPDGSNQMQDVAAIQRHQAGTAAIWIAAWSIVVEDKAVSWPGERATFKNRVDAVWDLPGRLFETVTSSVMEHVNATDAAAVAEKNGTLAGATT